MTHETSEHKTPENHQKPPKKNNEYINWLLWWKVTDEEMHKQTSEYESMKITQSARGLSLLLLLLSSTITTLFIVFLHLDPLAFIDVAVMAIIGFFCYKGQKWAFIAAMIMWTIEKILTFPVTEKASSMIVTTIVWWCVYMHVFYLGYKVESQRSKKHQNHPSSSS